MSSTMTAEQLPLQRSPLRVSQPDDPLEKEAEEVADRVMRMPFPDVGLIQRCPGGCPDEEMIRRQVDDEEEEEELVQRCPGGCPDEEMLRRQVDEEEEEQVLAQRSPKSQRDMVAPPEVVTAIQARRGGGDPLPLSARRFFEPRFATDFSRVRVHSDSQAAHLAASVNARAFTLGQDLFFGLGEWAPGTPTGDRLIAHELAHATTARPGGFRADWSTLDRGVAVAVHPREEPCAMVHESTRGKTEAALGRQASPLPLSAFSSEERVLRTPARQVSCQAGSLTVPGAPPLVVADPVSEITAAEARAAELLDNAIDELAFTRGQIRAGSGVGWPTISDTLGTALRVAGLDPDDSAVWSGTGAGSVHNFLRRLRFIRSPIGAGSIFFTCIGPDSGSIGPCSGDICAGGNFAASCPGSFRIHLCPPWWRSDNEWRARSLIHESAHNFAAFLGHAGRQTNVECFVRFAQILGGVDIAHQRLDLCPDP